MLLDLYSSVSVTELWLGLSLFGFHWFVRKTVRVLARRHARESFIASATNKSVKAIFCPWREPFSEQTSLNPGLKVQGSGFEGVYTAQEYLAHKRTPTPLGPIIFLNIIGRSS